MSTNTSASPLATVIEAPRPLTKAISSLVTLTEKVEGAFDLVVTETGKMVAEQGMTKADKGTVLQILENAGLYDPSRRSDVVAFVFASSEAKAELEKVTEYNATAPKNKLIGRNNQLRIVRASTDKPVTLDSILAERQAKEDGKAQRAARPPAGSAPAQTQTPAPAPAKEEESEEEEDDKMPPSGTSTLPLPADARPTATSLAHACEPVFKTAMLNGITSEELNDAFAELFAKYYPEG